MLHTQSERVGYIFNHFVEVEGLLLEDGFLAVEHRHLQNLFHQEAQPLGLIVYYRAQMLHHRRTLRYRLIVQHLCRQRDTCNRCLQFVGHIVYEVVLYFSVTLLTEDYHYRENECHQKDNREHDRRYHEPHGGEDVGIHVGEMYLHDTHLRLWVVSEQHLRIGEFLPFIRVVRTSIHFSAVLCGDSEVVRDIDSVVHHLRLQILVEQLEVDTLLQRFVGSGIKNGINHLVKQRFLIDIAVFYNFLQRL